MEEREGGLELLERSGVKASLFCREAGASYPPLCRWLDLNAPAPRLVELVEAGPATGVREVDTGADATL